MPDSKHPIKDTIDNMLQEAYELRINDVKASIEMILEAKISCESIDYTKGLARCNSYLGLFYMIISNNEASLVCSKKALVFYKEIEDMSGIAFAYYNIGSVHYKTANLPLGLEFLFKSLGLYQELKDKANESKTLKAIGYIYDAFGQFDKALETYDYCRKISREIGDKNGESNACNPLSGLYLKLKNYDKALETAYRSIKITQETGDTRSHAFALYAKAKVQSAMGDYELARESLLESLKIHREVGEMIGTAMCLVKLGKTHYLLETFDVAKEYLYESIKFSTKYSTEQFLSKAHYHLFRIAKAEGDDSLALKHHIFYHKTRKSIIEKGSKDKLRGMEAIWRTETLEREAKIQKEKNEEIRKKNKELDNFVYRVSHDLRGPISSLIGLYNIVKKEITDESSLYYFELYNRQITRLNGIIIDLIELTKVKDWQTKKIVIDFNQIVDDCLSAFTYLPNYDKITFNINIDKELAFNSDKSLINTIVQNLLENGIKYSSSNNPYLNIDVHLIDKGNSLLIKVADNGIGIDKIYHDKIFDMFFRACEEVTGTGLGMYILAKAVEKLNGKITLESKLGVGSSFEIIVPV